MVAANIGSGAGARRSKSIASAGATSDDLAASIHTFMTRRVALVETVIERAIARGEATADCDPRVVIETLVGPIWFRLLLTGEPIDKHFVTSVVALVASGVRAR